MRGVGERDGAERGGTRRAGGGNQQSLADPEPFRESPISLRVFLAEIFEEPAALADQHEKPAPRVMVLLVSLEVIRQPVDPLGEERDLDLGRPGISIVRSELLDEGALLLDGQTHAVFLPGAPPPIATSPEPRR